MKTIIKLTLVLCLFGSIALAGDMPSGNRNCPPEGCPPPPPPIAQQLGDDETLTTSDTTVTTTDVMINFVKGTLDILF